MISATPIEAAAGCFGVLGAAGARPGGDGAAKRGSNELQVFWGQRFSPPQFREKGGAAESQRVGRSTRPAPTRQLPSPSKRQEEPCSVCQPPAPRC